MLIVKKVQAAFKASRLKSAPMTSNLSVTRNEYRPSRESGWMGLMGTVLVYAILLAEIFFTITNNFVNKPPSASLTVINLRPPASPQDFTPKDKTSPEPMEKQEKPPEPIRAIPVKPAILPILAVKIPTAVDSKPVDPAPNKPETAAPQVLPAPAAAQVASNGRDTWEGRVLTQLNKFRRYPRVAMVQRSQGVPWIRFVMNREGKIQSVRIEKSSGFPVLDREALSLPNRAEPLPKPPDEVKGDTIELIVPVEFFMH